MREPYQRAMINLAAARASLDAALIALEELTEQACEHPEAYRTNTSTMGHIRWTCDPDKGGCGYEYHRDLAKEREAQAAGAAGGTGEGPSDGKSNSD